MRYTNPRLLYFTLLILKMRHNAPKHYFETKFPFFSGKGEISIVTSFSSMVRQLLQDAHVYMS